VASETCRADRGTVYDAGSRYLPYGELGEAASALPIPKPDEVALKEPEDFTLIGMPAKRLDSPDKVNGKAESGIDEKMPGLKFAPIAISPAFGGKVKSVDEAASLAVKGVQQVVRIDNAVAVIADHTWAARRDFKLLKSSGIAVRTRP
jgi:isoquinoline 1-oxidoreductase beta subunit